MLLDRFFINVLVRVSLIVLSGILLGILLQHFEHRFYYTFSGLLILIVLQSWLLVVKVSRANADLENFFASVQDHDSSIRFAGNPVNNSFRKLYERMDYLNDTIRNIRIENERTSQFLQSVVDHVDIGLLSYDLHGRTEICNNAARRYLKVQQLSRIDDLRSRNDELFRIIGSIRPGQEILHRIKTDKFSQNILIKAAELKFEDNVLKLVSFQDITSELEKKELDSWQRLIRVLTHEIMNSISPITSLASVISGYFRIRGEKDPIPPEGINHQVISKTLSGLNTIEETGKGLLDFVNNFRSLTALPKPAISKCSIESLFSRCRLLMESDLSDNIHISANINPDDLAIEADCAQVEQVLINLIKNAIEALSDKKDGRILLNAFHAGDSVLLQVKDNGAGIAADIIDDIFVPFYTTRRDGSGIGLSLSRQIMHNHEGTISADSVPGEGSVFTLRFPV